MGIVRAQRAAWPLLRSPLALLATLALPCLIALLVGWPIAETTASRSQLERPVAAHVSAPAPRQRAPDSMPLGLVWGGCCAALIAVGLLSVSLRRRGERSAEPERD